MLDVLDGVVDIGVILPIDGICEGETVLPIALGYGRDILHTRINILPDKITISPNLQQLDKEQY